MSIRTRNIHFTNWAKVIEALADKGVTVADEPAARTFLIETSSDANPYYYYVGYIKDTQEIYTHGKFYNCAGYDDTELRELIQDIEDSFAEQITSLQNEVEENEKVTTMALYDLNDRKANKDDLQNINLDKYVDWDSLYSETNSLYSSLQSTINSNYTTLNNNKADKTDLETLSAEVEENEEVTAAALTELHENKADKSEIPDVSTLATKADLNLKQDLLSAADFATVNGTSVLGGDNAIVIEEPDHYASGSATVEGSGFVTSVTTNEAGHVTNVVARAITDNDITSISASKITGTIDIDRLPHGALERLYVLTNRTAALGNTEISEGDTIMLTEENNTMFFCVSNTATTFDGKFREYTAASATSVAWSGVTGKPDGIDGWGGRISAVEADMDNYLPLSGGTITGEVTITAAANSPLKINSTSTDSGIYFNHNGVAKTWVGFEASIGSVLYHSVGSHRLGINNDGVAFYDSNTLLHSGNYSNYALPITGGTVNGQITSKGYDNYIAQGDTYTLIFGIGSGQVNRGIFDTTNSGWWIYRSDSTDTYIPNGNVAIGGTTASDKLHVYGTVRATGKMYAPDFVTTSDNRLKDFVSDIYVDFESLKQIPKKYYYWKDKSMGEDLQLGTSAQELAKIYPECVSYDEKEDKYSVSYQKLSIVALAAIDKLYDEIKELKSKLND